MQIMTQKQTQFLKRRPTNRPRLLIMLRGILAC